MRYNYDSKGFYTGFDFLSYTEDSQPIVPPHSTLIAPPVAEGKLAWWNGSAWELKDDPNWDYKQLLEYEKYLDSTDWYAIRYADSGVPIPDEVKAKRQAAREEIDRLRAKLEAKVNTGSTGYSAS